MLNLCWFEVAQTLGIADFMLVCYNFLYFSRKKKILNIRDIYLINEEKSEKRLSNQHTNMNV
jgi:hypothetical protein